MAVIARTTDRWGRPVVLTDAGWTHVLDGHGDMAGWQAKILETVARPDLVKRDARFADRENSYRIVAEHGTAHPRYLKVCIEYGPTGGAIITAFTTHRIKHAEQTKWP